MYHWGAHILYSMQCGFAMGEEILIQDLKGNLGSPFLWWALESRAQAEALWDEDRSPKLLPPGRQLPGSHHCWHPSPKKCSFPPSTDSEQCCCRSQHSDLSLVLYPGISVTPGVENLQEKHVFILLFLQ